MSTSRRQAILEELLARLQRITRDSGSLTDGGLTVFFGEAPELGADDPVEAVLLVVEPDEPAHQQAGLLINLAVTVYAMARADLEQPYLAAEALLGDIKRAVETEDRTLGGRLRWHGLERGITRTMPRDDGSVFVGVGVEYRMQYAEGWGNP
jgi:hypothetical protein